MARKQQAAAGITVQPMDEFDVILRVQQAHRVDDAPGNA